jgi:hypothetical protein
MVLSLEIPAIRFNWYLTRCKNFTQKINCCYNSNILGLRNNKFVCFVFLTVFRQSKFIMCKLVVLTICNLLFMRVCIIGYVTFTVSGYKNILITDKVHFLQINLFAQDLV